MPHQFIFVLNPILCTFSRKKNNNKSDVLPFCIRNTLAVFGVTISKTRRTIFFKEFFFFNTFICGTAIKT